MGESSTCLMHAFSYASGTPNQAKEGNSLHALGESISFGRFMTDSLSWEKFSSFSQTNNRYVEEAEKYSKPGSVAQKKAFFEAHYKRIAAHKAAAAAAAAAALLVEEANHSPRSEPHASQKNESKSLDNEEDWKSEMEKPLLKETLELMNKKKPTLGASKLSLSTPRGAKPKAALTIPINRNVSMNSTPVKEVSKLSNLDIMNTKSSKVVATYGMAYNCSTPLRTPAPTACRQKQPSGTPQSEIRRTKMPLHPSASGSKTTGPKWRFLAMDFSKTLGSCRNKSRPPVISSPFSLRTEERAVRRKEKLEEKFNEKVVQKVQLQTKIKDKAESEIKKLRQTLCFKARPLPEFYKDRKPAKNQIQSPLKQLQGNRPSPSAAHGISSLPSKWPASKSKHVLPKNKIQRQINAHFSLADMIMHENTSPNIQF